MFRTKYVKRSLWRKKGHYGKITEDGKIHQRGTSTVMQILRDITGRREYFEQPIVNFKDKCFGVPY